ncbi:MAG TPA: glycosyltransferase [Alphaproteobacteria bacterium]|nr:glycosyltransferase [Alphaproteobacteria bacterium]
MAADPPPLKVMHVITGLHTGGAERMLERLVLARRERPIAFRVVALVPGGAVFENLTKAGIPVTSLGMRRRFPNPSAVFRLARLIRKERPDVVQSWLYHADLVATFALLVSGRRQKTKLFWNVRCSSMEAWDRGWRQAIVIDACIWFASVPDAVIANSEAGREYHRRLGYRPRRFLVIDNGIDSSSFRPDAATRREVRAELGIPESQPLIAMLARLDPVKDHETFLKALATLPDVAALLIGEGTENLEPRPNLYRLGERSDVPRLLAACDIVVSSSTSEGFPNALLEGMAAGLPAVATDAGDSRRIVGDTGIIVPAGDPAALAGAMAQLLGEDAAHRAARREAARCRIVEKFSLERSVGEFDALYSAGA